MRLLETESFDRFGRYSHVWEVRRQSLAVGPLRILDVGDPYGLLSRVFPDDFTVSVDLMAEPRPGTGRHAYVVGSGLDLPFADGSFDLVTTHDTLEHIPAELRERFFDELVRVGSGPVLLVAPFRDPRTERCESLVNAFYTARFGHGQEQLEEHREYGLPDLNEMTRLLDDRQVAHAEFGDGWLYSWLAFMLVKAHLLSEDAEEADRLVDTAYNQLLREDDHQPPHYRRTIVMRPPQPMPALPPVSRIDETDDVERLSAMAMEITTALPRGVDATGSSSPVRKWARERAQSDPTGPVGAAGRALEQVLAAVNEQFGSSSPSSVSPLPQPASRLATSVSVVIVNMDGAEHLRTCLDSLALQDYPRQLVDVIVVDNASNDDSREVASEYAGVRVLPQETNIGFAPAVNQAVGQSQADCMVLLNNDTRVEPDFLSRLVEAYDPADRVVCVGSKILSWDGTHLDFGEGAMNFYGMGMQVGFGLPENAVSVDDGRELLFACGGAMLVDRHVYVAVGGFDESFFAYFEDVDFGWRLRILGYRTRLAAGARCYHRMQGTSSRFPYYQRVLLYERNALRSILKNYSADNLPRVVSAALLLLCERAARRGGLDRRAYDFGTDREPSDRDVKVAFAHLHAVADVVDDLESLLAKRAGIQRARKVGDDEVTRLFQFPLDPVDPHDGHLLAAQRAIVEAFGLDQWLGRHERAHHVVVITTERVADKMRGPAIRALELAKALAGDVSVTLAAYGPIEAGPESLGLDTAALKVASFSLEQELMELARTADVVVIQGYTLQRYPALASLNGVLVADLYDPWLFENLEVLRDSGSAGPVALRRDAAVINELLDTADFFLCASERQRDYWLGLLTARGRIDASAYALDATLRRLIDVVPFGVPDSPPRHDRAVLKGVHPDVTSDDLVILWGGGTWDWFDPVSVIEAMPAVLAQIPQAKLYFLGLQLVDSNVAHMGMAEKAVARAEALGLAGTSVIFGDWVDYDERQAYLREADVAVSAARDLAETRLAFRSRLLDAFWAGLPVVTTAGDALSDVVRDERAGLVVVPGDVGQLAHALVRLLGDPILRAECSARSLQVGQRLTWRQAVAPLRELVRQPWGAVETRRLRSHGRLATDSASLLRMYRDDHAELAKVEREERAELEKLQVEVEHLRAVVEHQDRRLSPIRNNPAYRLFQRAKRYRQSRH